MSNVFIFKYIKLRFLF